MKEIKLSPQVERNILVREFIGEIMKKKGWSRKDRIGWKDIYGHGGKCYRIEVSTSPIGEITLEARYKLISCVGITESPDELLYVDSAIERICKSIEGSLLMTYIDPLKEVLDSLREITGTVQVYEPMFKLEAVIREMGGYCGS